MPIPFGFRWFTVGFSQKKDLLESCLCENRVKPLGLGLVLGGLLFDYYKIMDFC